MSVALVTGGSRGIGRAIVLELARLGFDVAINYLSNEAAAADTAVEARMVQSGVLVEIVQGDVGVAADREQILRFVRDRFRRLDLLVNNAGVAPLERTDLLEATEESFDRLVRTNLKGPYFLSQAAARWMIEQRAARGADYHPAIVNIGSVSAIAASPSRGDYCVTKAGVSMMTQLFAARLAEHGVNVYEVRPGIIATDMTAAVKDKYDEMLAAGLAPMRRWGTPEDVARTVSAVAQGLLSYSTGEVLHVDGGFHVRRL